MSKLVKGSFSLVLCLTTITSISDQPNVEVVESEEHSEIVTHGIEDAPIF